MIKLTRVLVERSSADGSARSHLVVGWLVGVIVIADSQAAVVRQSDECSRRLAEGRFKEL